MQERRRVGVCDQGFVESGLNQEALSRENLPGPEDAPDVEAARSANGAATRARRGRPLRLPEDSTPFSQVHGGSAPLVAWLLATSRIYAADGAYAQREAFAAALRALGVAADPTRVSRWESGASRPAPRVLQAYERVLGLRPGQISVVAEGITRSLDPTVPVQREWFDVSPEEIHSELDALFERILSPGAHDGLDWLQLTARLTGHAQVYLRPQTWAETASLLVRELCRSVGVAHVRRYEAMRLLVRHPVAQRHAVKALGAFVTHPHAQVVSQPLILLQEVDDAQASDLVLRMLTGPPGMLRRGAAWVAASKLARDHFDDAGQAELEAMVMRMLDRRHEPRIGLDTSLIDAIDVACCLPRERAARVLIRLRNDPSTRHLAQTLHHGEIVAADDSRRTAVRVAEAIQADLATPQRLEPDQMLVRLVREALFHNHKERRNQASLLLGSSPYGPALHRHCLDLARGADDLVAMRALTMLWYGAPDDCRDGLRELAWHDPRPHVRSRALMALAHVRGGVTADVEDRVLEAIAHNPDPRARHAGMYALGMSGAETLKLLAAECEHLAPVAEWWIDTGPAIYDED